MELSELLTRSDDRVRLATLEEAEQVLAETNFAIGRDMHADRIRISAQAMVEARWRFAELHLAKQRILTDATLIKEASYAKGAHSGIFAMAREHPDVQRGKLHSYYQALAYCRQHWEPAQSGKDARAGISVLFRVVRVEGYQDADGMLLPCWVLR